MGVRGDSPLAQPAAAGEVPRPRPSINRRWTLLSRLVKLRPWCYHLTSRENLTRIRSGRELWSSEELLRAAGRGFFITERRAESWRVEIGADMVTLRDQKPLHRGNIEYSEGWEFPDVVRLLNGFVFFWPGTEEGPNPYGQRHFERYRSERPTILRVRTRDLAEAAGDRLRLCQYNSGAPRCSGGRKSPRGPDTFLTPDVFPGTASQVVEVVVHRNLPLPQHVEVAPDPAGPFTPLEAAELTA